MIDSLHCMAWYPIESLNAQRLIPAINSFCMLEPHKLLLMKTHFKQIRIYLFINLRQIAKIYSKSGIEWV